MRSYAAAAARAPYAATDDAEGDPLDALADTVAEAPCDVADPARLAELGTRTPLGVEGCYRASRLAALDE